MARRRFTAEYKQEAVALVQQSDIPVAEIARNLGLHDNSKHCIAKKMSKLRARKQP